MWQPTMGSGAHIAAQQGGGGQSPLFGESLPLSKEQAGAPCFIPLSILNVVHQCISGHVPNPSRHRMPSPPLTAMPIRLQADTFCTAAPPSPQHPSWASWNSKAWA